MVLILYVFIYYAAQIIIAWIKQLISVIKLIINPAILYPLLNLSFSISDKISAASPNITGNDNNEIQRIIFESVKSLSRISIEL